MAASHRLTPNRCRCWSSRRAIRGGSPISTRTSAAVREMRGVSKSAEPVTIPAEVSNIMRRAMSNIRNGRSGPAIVEIPDRYLERGDRRPRLHAGRRAQIRSGSGRCAQGRGGDPGGQAPGDLCRHRRAVGRSLGRTARIRGTAGRAGHHQPRRQEFLPGEPSAVAGVRRQRGAEAGASLRAERRRHHRHRLLVHRDQFRHQVPQGEDVHPRDAGSRTT